MLWTLAFNKFIIVLVICFDSLYPFILHWYDCGVASVKTSVVGPIFNPSWWTIFIIAGILSLIFYSLRTIRFLIWFIIKRIRSVGPHRTAQLCQETPSGNACLSCESAISLLRISLNSWDPVMRKIGTLSWWRKKKTRNQPVLNNKNQQTEEQLWITSTKRISTWHRQSTNPYWIFIQAKSADLGCSPPSVDTAIVFHWIPSSGTFRAHSDLQINHLQCKHLGYNLKTYKLFIPD